MYKTEQKIKKADCILLCGYLLYSAALLIYHTFFHFSGYYMFLSAASAALMFVPPLVYRLLRTNPNPPLTLLARLFIFLAFDIGMASKGYSGLFFYDKIVHFLSGIFFAFVGLLVFYFCKHTRRIEKTDFPLCLIFSFSFSMMIAAIWEIYEYLISFFLHTDPQASMTTGVGDTMGDIIACLFGTIIICISIVCCFKKGKTGLFLSAVKTYVENLKEKTKRQRE